MNYGYCLVAGMCALICTFALASDSERCSCHKPPRTDTPVIHETQPCPDTTTVQQPEIPVCNYHAEEKCSCNKPPRAEDTSLCPCSNKPRSDDTNLCSCGKPKPHKEPITGAELFIGGSHAIINCVEGGIISHNTGNIKEGLPYIMEGIMALANLTSRSADPEKAYQDLYKFITSLNQKDLDNLLKTARTHVITPSVTP